MPPRNDAGYPPGDLVLLEMAKQWSDRALQRMHEYSDSHFFDWTDDDVAVALVNVQTVFEATAMEYPMIMVDR